MGSALVDMNNEARQHHQGGEVMKHIADYYDPPGHKVIKPHEQSSDQKYESADRDGPKIELLATIEETGILRLDVVSIGRVVFQPPSEFAIGGGPGHRRKPIDELKKKEDREYQTEPGM